MYPVYSVTIRACGVISFVFYIGYLYNRNILLETIKGSALGMLIYTTSGFIIIILAIVSFLSAPKK